MINSGRITPFFTTRLQLIKSIKRKGWEITVSGYEKEEKLCEENNVLFENISFSRAGLNPINDFKVINHYRKIMKAGQYDVVHSYTIKPNIYGSIAAGREGIKRIYPTVNGLGYSFTEVEQQGIKSKLIRFAVTKMYKKAFFYATKVFFQNVDDARLLVNKGVLPENKCVVVPGSGVDLNAYPFTYPETKPMRFLIATRLLKTKGVQTFFAAASMVKEQFPMAQFWIAGGLDPNPDGIRKEELNTYIESGFITYLGHVDDMASLLAKCSVFVLPSYYREGVPHAILEAMSTGRAIITCNTPGCKETIKNPDAMGKGENGFLIDPRNEGKLANVMGWMIQHVEEVARMGLNSRKYAEEKFDVQKVNRILMKEMEIGYNDENPFCNQ